MNEIHMLLSVSVTASEAFVEGMKTVDAGTFLLLLTCFFFRVQYEQGFYFSITEVFLCT